LVRDRLDGFIHEPWVKELDLATPERVNPTYVTADLREREDDVIWRVRFRWIVRWRSGCPPTSGSCTKTSSG